MKTGALIEFACEAGAILGGADGESRAALRGYARDLGLAFQIADDLLDVEASTEQAGKPTGQDAAAGKATFVGLMGQKRARVRAEELVDSACGHLDRFGEKADLLRHTAQFVVNRQS
jgi:farnesyl diphosphate synthase